MSKWQIVFSTTQLHKAEIVKSVLHEKGFNPIIIDKQDSIYKIGYFEVRVTPDEVIRSLKIIEDEIKFG